MSRLFVHVAKLATLLRYDRSSSAAPVRYRFVGQLLEITYEENIEKQYVCELRMRNLPEFGIDDYACSQEEIRAVVGESVYRLRFLRNGCNSHQPQRGDAISVCLGVVMLNSTTRVFEVMDINVLTMREVQSLHSFADSSMGFDFVQ